MSAFYSFVYPDRICILTDGGIYDAEGKLVATRKKVFASPNLPFGITCRASDANRVPEIIDAMDVWINRRTNPLARDRVLAITDPIEEFFQDLGKREGTFPAEFLFAGYSNAAGPQQWLLLCHELAKGIAPFKLWNPGNDVQAGTPVTFADLMQYGVSPLTVRSPTFPQRFGATFMSIARKKPGLLPGGDKPFHMIGGHADLTTITADGVTVERLCTWPDEIGRPIDPSLPMTLPDGREVAA